MIVLDASAAIDWLLQTSAGQSIEKRIYSRNETLHAPHLFPPRQFPVHSFLKSSFDM
jgi:predicted nucleic acid-binding protein